MPWQKRKTPADLGAKANDPEAGMDALARLLSTRERSLQEASKRLREKGYQDATVAEVLERAQACGLLDDERFAEHYTKDKLRAGWGQRRIGQELRQFGIDNDLISNSLEALVSTDDQLASATKALERHPIRSKNPRQSAYRFLAGKGYNSDIISQAIEQVL